MTDSIERPHARASYLPKLQKSAEIILTDIDKTASSGEARPSMQELADRRAIWQIAAQRCAVLGAVSARTPALMMTSKEYEASLENGFTEPPPRWGVDESGKRVFVPLEDQPYFAHSLGWDVLLGYGWGVLPKNGSGYLVDRDYDRRLNFDYRGPMPTDHGATGEEAVPLSWRVATLALLYEINPTIRQYLTPLEFVDNYRKGVTDVAPLPYRITLRFPGPKGLRDLRALVAAIGVERQKGNRLAYRIQMSDESTIGDTEEDHVYQLYLTPWWGRKENMVNYFIVAAAYAAGLPTSVLRVRTAGDQWTDLKVACYAGGNLPLVSLIATGSPIGRAIVERRVSHGHLSLTRLLGQRTPDGYQRLRPTGRKGEYLFEVYPRRYFCNTIVIGDEVYPNETPPGSVRRFLEEYP